MRLLSLVALVLLTACSCNKENITPTGFPPAEATLVVDSTYGEYTLVNMIDVDSLGNENSNPTYNMTLNVTPTDIEIYQLGVLMESYPYSVTSVAVDTNYYSIPSGYGPPCDDYNIAHDTLSMFYLTIPANGVGCYRVLKSLKN
jgi:hypothetical protein